MTGELVPDPGMRVSDAERNSVVERLSRALGEGRLTLAEFDERVGGVLAAVTRTDLEPFTADLPETGSPPVLQLRARASSLRRSGQWVVPRRVVLEVQSSGVRLDFTSAVITSPTVEVTLDARSSGITLVLPRGGSANLDEVELSSSTARSKVPDTGGPHLVIRGRLQSSTLRVRYPRRFLRWRR